MAELPKSVKQRLGMQPAGEHPDANLLTAFSEQALTGRERDRVLAHLAVCSECREVVSLALPDEATQQPVLVMAPWYRRPATYAWSALLATFVVGAALVVNYDSSRSATNPRYAAEEKLPAAAPTPQRNQETASLPPPSQQVQKADERAALKAKTDDVAARTVQPQRQALAKKEAPRPNERPTITGHLSSADTAAVGVNEAGNLPPAAAAPPVAEAQVTQQRAMRAEEGGKDAVAQAAPLTKPQPTGGNAVGGAAVASRYAAQQTADNVNSARMAKVAVISRWTVSSDGHLQRSSDGGRTWNDVAVATDARFRAVAVVNNEVWAGGTALYHSADAGSHWTQQTLPGAGAEITSLSFDDVQHGTARTADGMKWSTTDGGQHWTKQPST